jgi:PAS domain S-box-containing protein
VIRSSNDGIVATDEHLGIVIFNPGAESIFGYPQEEVVYKLRLPELLPENMARAFLQAMTAADGRKDWPWTETEFVSRTGECIPVRFSGSILNERGKKLGYVEADMSLIVENNLSMRNALDHMGAKVYKTYRIYGKKL